MNGIQSLQPRRCHQTLVIKIFKKGLTIPPANWGPLPRSHSFNVHRRCAIKSTSSKVAVDKRACYIFFLAARAMTCYKFGTLAERAKFKGQARKASWRNWALAARKSLQKPKEGIGPNCHPLKLFSRQVSIVWKANTLGVHGWLSLIVDYLLKIRICKQLHICRHVKHACLNVETLMKYVSLLVKYVEQEIVKMLPDRFALIFNNWETTGMHYKASSFMYSATTEWVFASVFVDFSPLENEEAQFTAKHVNLTNILLQLFGCSSLM